MQAQLPRIGVLALMLPDYEELFPGITQRQAAFAQSLLQPLGGVIDFRFTAPALGRQAIQAQVTQMKREGCDGILVLPLTYSQGQYLVKPCLDARLPLALALVQPEETATAAFEEIDLTVNQAIHGAQDQANCLKRAGIPYVAYAGHKGATFNSFVEDFSAAAQTVARLRRMRIGVIGKLPGMGDVVTDDMAFFRKIGPEFVYDSIGAVWNHTQQVKAAQVRAVLERDRAVFDLDGRLEARQLQTAAQMYLGLKHWLEAEGYDGFTIQFSEFGADGRFAQLPLLAASHLLADGYGYAAEGDASCAALVAGMSCLCGSANFTEMYMMDLARDALLFCHAGEGNWQVARKDKKPRLIDRPLSEGGLSNPPTVVFTPQPGEATVMSIVHRGGESFALLTARGQVLADDPLARCEMPYMFFRPDCGARECAEKWLKEGGTHHEAVVFGDCSRRIRLLCQLLGIEHVSI